MFFTFISVHLCKTVSMLSVLIPTYNYDVSSLVETIYKQCKEADIDFEILVLDDCSTESIIADNISKNPEFHKLIVFRNEINLGRTSTRKILAEKSQYDWILFLDADVIPTNENFISEYIRAIQNRYKVILGGCSYHSYNLDCSTIFRWKYGVEREEAPANKRNKNPYGYILSGNILIDKQTFLENNYNENRNLYGMDNYFSYNLFRNKIAVFHIDNPIIHIGLEMNDIFFRKSLQSVENRKKYLADLPDIEKTNSLLKHYKRLKKLRLTGLVSFIFKISEPYLKKKILSQNPNIFLFDLYRLGYICSI